MPHPRFVDVGDYFVIATLIGSEIETNVFVSTLLALFMFGHFVSYMLMLGHASERAPCRDSRYRMFHVKHVVSEWVFFRKVSKRSLP